MPAGNGDAAAPLRLLAVQSRTHADQGGAISTNVVLIGAKLAAFGSDTLELLLGWGVGVANVHGQSLFADARPIELANNLIASIPGLEAAGPSVNAPRFLVGGTRSSPGKANAAAVPHAVAEDLARQDGVTQENGGKFLHTPKSDREYNRRCIGPSVANHLRKALGKVRNVQVGRVVVSLCLETGVEGLLLGG